MPEEMPDYLASLFEDPGFQRRLDAVGEQKGRFKHPCGTCLFLGQTTYQDVEYDLWCHDGDEFIARYGNGLHKVMAASKTECLAAQTRYPEHPVIVAYRRFIEGNY